MPPTAHEIMKSLLSAMADTEDVSWVFYAIAFFQLSVAACHLSKYFRGKKILTILIIISSLIIPTLLVAGFYFSTKPIA